MKKINPSHNNNRERAFVRRAYFWRRHSEAGDSSGEMRGALLVALVAAACVNLSDAAGADKWKTKKCVKKAAKGLCNTAACPSKKKKCKKTAKKCQSTCGAYSTTVTTPTRLCSCSAYANGASLTTHAQGVCIKAGICRPASGGCPSDMTYCDEPQSPPPPPPPLPIPEGAVSVPGILFNVVLSGDVASFDTTAFRSAGLGTSSPRVPHGAIA